MKLCVPAAIVTLALGTSACSLLFGEDFDNAFPRASDGGTGEVEPGDDPTSPVAPNPDGSCASDRKKCGDLCVSLLDPSFGCAAATCSPCSAGDTVCSDGVCAASCADGQTACNGTCVEPSDDPKKCAEPGVQGLWTAVASMPTARSDLGAAMGADGRIFAIGGSGFTSGNPINVVEAYTPSSDSWAKLASMPTPRAMLAVTRGADGRIFAIGGYTNYYGDPTAAVEAYTPSTNSWATVASMPTARSGLAAVTAPDGRIFAIGGTDIDGYMLTTVEAYTPSTNTWATLASMKTARHGHAASLSADGRVFVFGGYSRATQTSGTTIYDTVEAYTPSTNSWATVASMPTARRDLAATRGADGRIFAIGGDDYGLFDTVEAYTPGTNAWGTVASMLTARGGLAAVTTPDGRIFAIGGYRESGINPSLATVERYTP